MIQSLRRRHRWMMAAVTIILPVIFVAGLAVRKPVPASEQVPAGVAPLAADASHLLFEKDDLWNGLPISTRLFAAQQPATLLAVELHPRVYFKFPEILVYWHSSASTQLDKLPEESYLLGTLAGKENHRFVLPDSARTHDGALILYSLAQQKLIATAALPTRTTLAGGNPQ